MRNTIIQSDDDGEIVGTLVWRQGSGPTVEIFDIAVEAKARRKGTGRRMVHRLMKTLPPGTKTVWAITRASNLIAQEFYQSLGFLGSPLQRFYRDEPLPDGKEYADAIMYIVGVGRVK
jgi:ribosomal protein S18 acetylase RimI-like enzyme